MITRRRFLTTVAAAPFLAGFYAWGIEPAWVEYVQRDLPITDLSVKLQGKSLVQISDIHIGPQVDERYLLNVFARVAALQPDIVVYTGDYVTYAGPDSLERLHRIAAHFPMGRLGTIGVLGNHDYGQNWRETAVAREVSGVLAEVGCVMLRNQSVEVGGLRIGGLDDLWSGNLDLSVLLGAGRRPDLMLCHNPDACDLAGWDVYEGWILSGHTHGGQCKPPFLPAPLLPVKNRRYTAGRFELSGRRALYINRGLGHLSKVRFNVRPEVTIFKLRPA